MSKEELIQFLIREILEEKQLLAGILGETSSYYIDLSQYLDKSENFKVRRLKPILQRGLSFQTDGLLRINVAFNYPTKLVFVLNGNGVYLNQGQDLKENCVYGFDVPVKPNDSINLMADFDDSSMAEIECIFLRLFEVR